MGNRYLYLFLFSLTITVTSCSTVQIYTEEQDVGYLRKDRVLLEVSNTSLIQCIPSGIDAFPSDFLTQEQRLHGGVVIHFLIMFYICAMIGIVCKDYFIPSLEIISASMQLPSDIAGATFMAIGTSAPELFSSITGSFITEGDIGVGTIVGSAVFNIVGVSGIVGIAIWSQVLDIDWYPIARDCSVYAVTVITLIWIIEDNIVQWWESLVLLFIFFVYLIIMGFNRRVEKASRNMCNGETWCVCCREDENASLLSGKTIIPEIDEVARTASFSNRDSFSVEITPSRTNSILKNYPSEIMDEIGRNGSSSLCTLPVGGPINFACWIIMYPAKLLFYITIPDSSNPRLYKFFPVTFFMAVLWIGVLSYLAVWMVTVIGYTFSIPDSISGLTVLAIGTSVPEVITSIIVAKNGYGNMSISNLVGSNTFDISFCLGLPWLIKTLISEKKYLLVYSSALTYTTATLLLTLVAFVIVFQLSHWKFNKKVGLIFLIIYAVFLVLSCMYELNVFGKINVPTCDH
nr:sodium/potassium/calcium exchanger 3 isoform X3 [Parasteatoda tepidariorum]